MRHVIVTGGTRGLGLDLVRGLLAAGYRVSTCGRKPSSGLRDLSAAHPHQLFFSPASVEKESEMERFFEAALSAANKEDVFWGLVNNAGVAKEGILATFPNVESRTIIEINLLGSLYCARLALRYLLARPGGGRIINISSIIGSRGYTGLTAYTASKAGLDGLTRALSREVGRRQVTVNSVAPGYMRTEMSMGLTEDKISQIVRRTPLGRLPETADIVPAVVFLLSDQAAMITGQTITIDGGISV